MVTIGQFFQYIVIIGQYVQYIIKKINLSYTSSDKSLDKFSDTLSDEKLFVRTHGSQRSILSGSLSVRGLTISWRMGGSLSPRSSSSGPRRDSMDGDWWGGGLQEMPFVPSQFKTQTTGEHNTYSKHGVELREKIGLLLICPCSQLLESELNIKWFELSRERL